jgi:hypothetical protein
MASLIDSQRNGGTMRSHRLGDRHRSSFLATVRRWLTVPFCLACLVQLMSRPTQAFTDADNDGIDDGVEMSLAINSFPAINRQYDDNCVGPVPHPVLFRARYASQQGVPNTNYMVINYVVLHDSDCGWAFGIGGHPGDNEAFNVWLVADGSTWYEFDLSAHAHWNSVCEGIDYTNTQTMWIGGDKHSNYASPGDCGCDGTDSCDETVAEYANDYTFYNAGEPGHPMLTWLSQIKSDWVGGIWDYSQFEGAGVITEQFGTTGFAELIWTPDAAACQAQCWSTEQDCVTNEDDRDGHCEERYNQCYSNNCPQSPTLWDW